MKRLRGFRLALVLAGALALFWPARFGGYLGMTMVAGDSMEPGMYSGDLAVTVRQPSYGIGDPVVFEMPGLEQRYVIHRIVRTEPDGRFVTRGDNRATEDNWRVAPESILGKHFLIIPRCEHPLCRNLSLPVIFGIGLLGLAAGVWVYSSVRGPRRPDEPVVPATWSEPRTSEGVAMAKITAGCGSGFSSAEPVFEAATGALVGLRVHELESASPGGTESRVALAEHALALLAAARSAGANELVILIAGPLVRKAERTRAELEHLCVPPGDLEGLAVELTVTELAEGANRNTSRKLSERGVKIVLTELREGLLGNRRPLRRALNRHRADAVAIDDRDYDQSTVHKCLGETTSVICLGVEDTEQLADLYRHGLEWWSGPLVESHVRANLHGSEAMTRRSADESLTTSPSVSIHQ